MNQDKQKNEMNSDFELNSQQEDRKFHKRYFIYFFIFTILLFFCVFGITYSVYYGDSSGGDQEVETGKILFTYSDVNQAGNGIQIQNAAPIPDSLGKTMMGNSKYFDFYVTATTSKDNILYQILVNKDESSTLMDKNVKVYLTKVMGGYEQEIVLANFSDLKQEKIKEKDYYVLFEKTLQGPIENYTDSYRLRMWIDENASNYENQKFSIKVDVYAYQVEE